MKLEKREVIGKTWGYEEVLVNNSLYCGKILSILRNKSCSIHYHEKKLETLHIIEGGIVLEMYQDKQLTKVKTILLVRGDTITIPPRTPYRFFGIEPVNRFIEFSNYDNPKDTYQLREV